MWEAGKDHGKKPIALAGAATARAQGKLLWDIAEVQVPSGGDVRYWIEAKDNDSSAARTSARRASSTCSVVSPRERHEETLGASRRSPRRC